MGLVAFICAIDVHWQPLRIGDVAMHCGRLLSSAGSVELVELGPFVALVARGRDDGGHVATVGEAVAVGNVRLDALPTPSNNLVQVRTTGGGPRVALRAWQDAGRMALRSFVGDFALIMFDGPARRLVACRDAFGVRLLVTRRVGSIQLFASHAWLIGGSGINREYVADLIMGGHGTQSETMFTDVTRIAAGTALEMSPKGSVEYTLWSSLEVGGGERKSGDPDEFLGHLTDAIRAQTQGEERFWTQLSGGVDSSSVTSLAAVLARSGTIGELAGSVTFVDTLGTGDESMYSDAVVEAFGITNRKLIDYWPWRDDGQGPPGECDPHAFFAFYELRRALCNVVKEDGSRVLLTGIGSDHYLSGNYDYVSDWVWQGRFAEAFETLSTLAIGRKGSFWGLLKSHALVPLLPFGCQARLVPEENELPAWFPRDFVRRCSLKERVVVPRQQHVPRGQLGRYQIDRSLRSLDHGFTRGVYETEVEARHPFLYRPLVEYSLSLPHEERLGPLIDKVVLRRAVKGILPETIRTRTSKGDIDARISWALHHENRRLRHLVDHSILADLGCVEPRTLTEALERGRRGVGGSDLAALFNTLSLESWLSAHFGKTGPQSTTQPSWTLKQSPSGK